MNLEMSNQPNSGLLRFRSAPSSLFANFSIGIEKGSESNNDGLTSSRFLVHGGGGGGDLNVGQTFQDLIEGGGGGVEKGILGNGYSLNNNNNNQELLPPHYPRQQQSCSNSASAAMDSSCFSRVVTSMGLDNHHLPQPQQVQAAPPKMGSGLLRQNSSPAGLFSNLTPQNGFTAIRGVCGFRGVGLSRISEIEADSVGEIVHNDNNKVGNGNGENQFYGSDYPFSSWNDSSHFTDNYNSTGLKQEHQDDDKLFLGSQNGKLLNRPPMLSHHLSLPKASPGELTAIEKLLHFQDSVPCKIRAKRGCATHPRSIAERVRRTRISERMRKLQELVPNMDKQTNTADMLDLAVDYIKDLQNQFKTLNNKRENCRCSGMQKPVQI